MLLEGVCTHWCRVASILATGGLAPLCLPLLWAKSSSDWPRRNEGSGADWREAPGKGRICGLVLRGGSYAQSDGGGSGAGPGEGRGGRRRDGGRGGGGGGQAVAGRAGRGGGSRGRGGAGPRRAVGGAMEQQPRRPPAGREAQAGWAAALLGRERQAREYCPGVNNQPYVCETGHCCGETGCCIYYYELWWFWLLWTVLFLFGCCCAYRHRRAKLRLQQQQRQREINLIAYHGACNYPPSMMDLRMLASFKLPAYEEVAHRPTTPPPPYSAILGGSGASRRGSSTLTLTGSSENYTSCSCESSCLTSPSSTSLSATEASTPSEAGETEVDGAGGCSSGSTAGTQELAGRAGMGPAAPFPRHTLFSSNVELFEGDPRRGSDSEEGPEPTEEGEHSRHRRLTGDSGIEVGRGQEDEEEDEEEEEAAQLLEKGGPCSPSSTEARSLFGGQAEGDPEELAPSSSCSPTLPV